MEKTTVKHRVRNIVLILLAVLLILLIGALAFAGNYLFHFALDPAMSGGMLDSGGQEWEPDPDNFLLQDGAEDRWLLSRDGLALHGIYLPQKQESHLYAVLCHGYGGEPLGMAHSAEHFYALGYNILAPAARAHERSGGTYASMGWLERLDIVDWVNTLVTQDPAAQVVLYGVSMGGATVMMTAGEKLPDNVKCVIEDCGYSSVWDEFAGQLHEMFGLPPFPLLNAASLVCQLQAGFGFEEASSVEQLKKATLPILFIHGETDTFVPYAMLDIVYEACASAEKERLSIPEAAHAAASAADPELYWSTVERFLAKYICHDQTAKDVGAK